MDYVVDETCSRMRENCTPSTTTSCPSFLSTSSSSSSSSSSFSSNFWNLSSRADRSHLVIDFVFSTLGKQEISGSLNSTVSLFTDYEILKGNRIFFFSNFNKNLHDSDLIFYCIYCIYLIYWFDCFYCFILFIFSIVFIVCNVLIVLLYSIFLFY